MMASTAAFRTITAKPKPVLMLKDFLRDDPNSDSFRRRLPPATTTTVAASSRVAADHHGRPALVRSNSSKYRALAKIIKLFSITTTITTSCSSKTQCRRPKNSILPRSLSKRLFQKSKTFFWKKKSPEICRTPSSSSIHMISTTGRILVRDIVRLGSFVDELRGGNTVVILKPTPTTASATADNNSTCSCSASEWWSEWDSSLSSPSDSAASSEFNKATTTTTTTLELQKPAVAAIGVPTKRADEESEPAGRRNPTTKEGTGESLENTGLDYEEENEQLSPISVLDFPDDEEEEDEEGGGDASAFSTAATTSSPFHQDLANIERANHLPTRTIRRLECLAESVSPVDLLEYFDAAAEEEDDDEEEEEENELQFELTVEEARATELLEELKREFSDENRKFSPIDDGLLLDFFVEAVHKRYTSGRKTWCEKTVREAAELLDRARVWLDGPRGAGAGASERRTGGEAVVEEMDRDGRWRLFDEQEDEIAAALEDDAVDSLLDEILHDMLSSGDC